MSQPADFLRQAHAELHPGQPYLSDLVVSTAVAYRAIELAQQRGTKYASLLSMALIRSARESVPPTTTNQS